MINKNFLLIIVFTIIILFVMKYSEINKWNCSEKGCEYNIVNGKYNKKSECNKICKKEVEQKEVEQKEVEQKEVEKNKYSYVCTTDNRCQIIKGDNGTFRNEGDCLQSCFQPYFPSYYPQSMIYPYDNLLSPYYNSNLIRRHRRNYYFPRGYNYRRLHNH